MTATALPETFPALLREQVRRAGARPLVTFYDDTSGERVELSVTTYANWVAKTAGLLQDELDVERGATVALDLPTHWLGPVWLGAVWSVGAAVAAPRGDDADPSPDLVVCGPTTLTDHVRGDAPVVALSLLPMGARFRDPLPPGVVDFGAVVWGQPDAFTPYDEPVGGDAAWTGQDGTTTQRELLTQAAGGPWGEEGTRLLTGINPCSRQGAATLLGPLSAGGGTVWVAHPSTDSWSRRAEIEHATVTVLG